MPELSRIYIDDVRPSVSAGRYPAKCVSGDWLEVSANIVKDGHDLLAARIWYGPADESRWSSVPMEHRYAEDLWVGRFQVDRVGPWKFRIEAWYDEWATFVDAFEKRRRAGQALEGELLEAVRMLRTARSRADVDGRRAIDAAIAALEDAQKPLAERIDRLLSPELRGALPAPLDPAWSVEAESVPLWVDRPRARFGAWYEVFPRSLAGEPGKHGTFSDLERHLPRYAELGFDVIYLPPIHPIGRAERKGPNNTPTAGPGDPGSPWAIGGPEGGHAAIHPELGTIDDFDQMVATAKSLELEIALDYALQCSPDHPWLRDHPDWFYIRADGTIRYAENPPKKYQDIYPLNFWCAERESLWNACLEVLQFWVDHGVRIFRVDNPHTKPLAFWEWAIAEIHRNAPDVVFLAEAFTRPNLMYTLAKLGFQQSYTYFTWKNDPAELREFITELTRPPVSDFYRPNFFANTPDILHAYLQHGGRPAFRIRLLLAATLSPTYGIYSGFEVCENVALREGSEEYLDSEKYQLRSRDPNAPGNIQADVQRINQLRREHPALQQLTNLTFLASSNERILWYRKSSPGDELWIAVTLDPSQPQEAWVQVPLGELGLPSDRSYAVADLLTGETFYWNGDWNYVRFDPSERVAHVFEPIELRGRR